ncbi:MAG: sugar ABC transporter substrate-binding protein [Acidobacteria bacterium]|nr:sugar ABC transporter substrate-binding protein [Acidobacteriota bacterium]
MKKLRFLLSLHTSHNDFQIAQASSAEQIARKLGIDLEIVYANSDAVTQSTQILNAIQGRTEFRPDAIILEPVSNIALPQAAGAAAAAGIGWAVLNRTPDYIAQLRLKGTAAVFAVGMDNVEIGRIQGRQFAALLPKGGTVLYLEGPSRSSSAQKRSAGMLETKPSNIQVVTLKGDWTEESARRAVQSWLKLATSQNQAIDLIGAQDDTMAMGSRRAFQEIVDLKEQQRWLKLPFTGCDGQPATGQAWVRDGFLTATIYIPPFAGQAIEILANAVKTGKQPPAQATTTSYSIPPLDELERRKS